VLDCTDRACRLVFKCKFVSGKNRTSRWTKGSYQLPHVYDYLLSASATPGGQSFRRRQQRLP